MAVAAREHPNGRARAVADLIHRSFAGPIGNVLAIGAFLFGTDLFREHPVSTGLYLGMLAFRLAARIVLTLVWRRTQSGAQFPLWLIGLSAYTLSAPTGLYAAYVIRQYGCGDWNTFFIYVFAATCAISGTIAIAPDLRMAVGYQLSLLMPIAFVSLSMGDRHAYILGASTLLFATYALINSVRQNADYWTGVSRDMALQRRAEELQAAKAAADAANRAKSQFLANMSHEIRTPMNGVLGMLELALRDELPEPQRQQLGYAHESAQSLLSLLNAILDHSKAEAGRLELEQTDFDLRETLDNALGPFMSQAAGKGISLTTSIDPAVWRFLRGDPTRLRQVLVNLLSNALKFTETGGVRVLVAVEAARAREIVLLFSVTDTGPGIPPEKQGLVFEAFAQGDGTITRRYGGTGLGLAICRDLVQLMGGRIWVESEPGAGSAFHFTAAFAPASGKLTEARRVEAAPIVSRPLRILIAEDNRINQKLITEVVKLGGHSSQIAENGQQVVSKCREDCFDLILMDVQMPVMDGLEATRLIRAMQGASGRRTPIIGVTAGATPAELAACLGSGMDSCITKPISIFDLERVFAQVSTGDTAPLTISHNQ